MFVEYFLLFCLILSAYGLGRVILPAWGNSLGSHAIIAALIGLLLLTFGYILLLSAGYANKATVSILVLAAALTLTADRSVPAMVWSPVLLSVGAVIALPTALQGIMTSGGSFPVVFFNIDNVYYLQFVHSILDFADYPPPRLDNYDLPVYGYHYGVMAFGALIAQFTGMAPHTAFMLWVPLFGITAFLASINVLLQTLDVDTIRERALVLFVLAPGVMELEVPTVSIEYLTDNPTDALIHLFKVLWLHGIGYEMEYQIYTAQFATLYGLTLCFISMSLTLAHEHQRHPFGYILVVSLMPLIKTPFMGFLGVGIGSYAIYRFLVSRDWRHLLIPVLAGGAMLAVFLFFGASQNAPTAGFVFGWPGSISKDMHNTILLYIFAGAFVLVATGTWRGVTASWINALWFFLPLLVLGLFLKIEQRNAYQLFTLVPWMATLYLVLISVRGMAVMRFPSQLAAAAVLLPLLIINSLALGHYIGSLISHPSEIGEFTDNRALADVLEKISPQDSLLVTNDLRYPAGGSQKDNQQVQIAALYGHRSFNAELVFSQEVQKVDKKSRSIYVDRLKTAKVFKERQWDADYIDKLVSRYPITHLLIHRSFPHPEDISLRLVAENAKYRLYAFNNEDLD